MELPCQLKLMPSTIEVEQGNTPSLDSPILSGKVQVVINTIFHIET